MSVVAAIAPPIRMPAVGIAARGVGSKAPTAIRMPGGADRGHADRGDRPRARVRDALDAPAGGDRRGGDHRGHERDRQHVDLEDERDQRADRGELHDRARGGDQRSRGVSPSCEPPGEPGRERRRTRPRRDLQDRLAHAPPRARSRALRRAVTRAPRPSTRRRRSVASATASASARSWVATITARSRCASAATVAAIRCAVSGSSAAVGSSSRIASRLARQRARQRDAGALAARERLRRARQERGVQPGGGQRRVAGVVGQRRQPVGEVVRDRPRQHHRRLRDQRHAPAQHLRVERRMSSPSSTIVPASGSASRVRQRSSVLLPAPDAPTSAST